MGKSLRPPTKKQKAEALAKDFETLAQKVGDDAKAPNKLSSTSRIMVGITRIQHRVPPDVADTDPILVAMVDIEYQARKLGRQKASSIDGTLQKINEDITRIGSAETVSAVELQNKYTEQVGMIKGDYQNIVEKQDRFHKNLTSTLEQKDVIFSQVVTTLAKEERPDISVLNNITTNFKELVKQSEKLTIEENAFAYQLKNLRTEVKGTAQNVTPSGPGTRLGD